MFEWDQHNLRKIKVHRVTASEVEEALSANPILIYEQDADGEVRYVYYGGTIRQRLLAVVFTERGGKIRVITAYELDTGQKGDYWLRRTQGE
ncbi:MAG: BrnT family toxin [Bryobacterales bacterium]|nr:BrnT family toxin [Bryobacterales bacterium]